VNEVHLFCPEESRPRYQRKLPKSLTEQQEAALIQYARDQIERCKQARPSQRGRICETKLLAARRDLFIVQFGLATGLRCAELCDLVIGDLDLDAKFLHVRHGKGDKERLVPLKDSIIPIIKDWIGLRQDGYLIPRDNGRQFSRITMHYRVRRLGRHAGLPKSIHPHVLRHTFAQRIYDRKRNLEVVRALLGHESVATTQIYAQASLGEMRDAVETLDD